MTCGWLAINKKATFKKKLCSLFFVMLKLKMRKCLMSLPSLGKIVWGVKYRTNGKSDCKRCIYNIKESLYLLDIYKVIKTKITSFKCQMPYLYRSDVIKLGIWLICRVFCFVLFCVKVWLILHFITHHVCRICYKLMLR